MKVENLLDIIDIFTDVVFVEYGNDIVIDSNSMFDLMHNIDKYNSLLELEIDSIQVEDDQLYINILIEEEE